jgi:hypothetical protein
MKQETGTHQKSKDSKSSPYAGAKLTRTSHIIVSGDRITVGDHIFEFFLTADHVSLILGLGDSTLRALEEDGELVPVRVRNQRRYAPQVLREYIERLETRARENTLRMQERRRLKKKEAELRDLGQGLPGSGRT